MGILRRPITILAIVIVIGVDFVWCESGNSPPCYSSLANWVQVGQWIEEPGYLAPHAPVPARTYRTAGGLVVRLDGDESPLPPGAKEVKGCSFRPVATWRSGLWGMTREHRGMYLEPNYATMTSAEVNAFPAAVLVALDSAPDAARYTEERQLLAKSGVTGRLIESRPRLAGYLHSGLVLALGCAVILGLASNILVAASAWRRRLRMRRGLCPQCGYELFAIPNDCPECGWAR